MFEACKHGIRHDAVEYVVVVTVVMAFKLYDFISSGVRPCDSDGTHCSLCPGGAELHHICARYHLADFLCGFDFDFCGRAYHCCVVKLIFDGFNNSGVPMSEY